MENQINALWRLSADNNRSVQTVTPVNNTNTAHPVTFENANYDLLVIVRNPGTNSATAIVSVRNVSVQYSVAHAPFLVPTHRIHYTPSSAVVAKAAEITRDAVNDVERVAAIHKWIIMNVTYDRTKEAALGGQPITVSSIPDPDTTLRLLSGICFDYSSLFAAMCRSLGIPTRMVIGNVARPWDNRTEYHAWNEVFLTNAGNITENVRAAAGTWVRLDTTFGVSMKDADYARHLANPRAYTQDRHLVF
jgi:transglutaminase-like putative cysteine protease